MVEWDCEHAVSTKAGRELAWRYWSDMANHARMEPGVERIELDGPFATGTTGRTIGPGYQQAWQLIDVVEGRHFAITGQTPDGAGALRFAWNFDDEGRGTRLTQRIRAAGPLVAEHLAALRQMEANAPKGLARLAAVLDDLAEKEGDTS